MLPEDERVSCTFMRFLAGGLGGGTAEQLRSGVLLPEFGTSRTHVSYHILLGDRYAGR